jgi:arylsulfatase A-like enzyme
MELLERHNITLNNSIIVVTADHGEEFLDFHPGDPGGPCHGRTLYTEQIRVPLILSIPGANPGKQRIDANVQLIDLPPTILDILGIDYGQYRQFQGRTLIPVIKHGGIDSPSQETRVAYSGGNHGRSVLIEGDWKYYSYDRYSKEKRERVFIRPGADYTYVAGEELYNIKTDPRETLNVINQEGAVAGKLKEKLRILKENIFSEKLNKAVELDNETKEQLKALGYVQ